MITARITVLAAAVCIICACTLHADDFGRVDRLWFDGANWRAEQILDNDYVSVAAVSDTASTGICWAARASGGVDLIYDSGGTWAADTYIPQVTYIDISRKHGQTTDFYGVTDSGDVHHIYEAGAEQGYQAQTIASGGYVSVTGFSVPGEYDKCWAARITGGIDLIYHNGSTWASEHHLPDITYTDINANGAGDGSFYGLTSSGRVDRVHQSEGAWAAEPRSAGSYTSVAGIDVAGYQDRCLASLADGGLVEMIPTASAFDLTRRMLWGVYADMEPVPGQWQPFAVTSIPASIPITEVKGGADGSAAACSGVVTAVFDDHFYIESNNRLTGMRVDMPGHQLTDADIQSTAAVAGYLRKRMDRESALQAVSVTLTQTGAGVRPLAINNAGIAVGTPSSTSIPAWGVSELTLDSRVIYTNPYTEVQLHAVFDGPNSGHYEIPGFWDGGTTWKIRFTPTSAGQWAYTTTCTNTSDAGLHAVSGTFTVDAYTGDNPLHKHGGFLKTSSDGHYLTYSDGTPFFWLGDTWWFCPSDLVPYDYSSSPDTPSAFKTLIDTRQSQGYSVVQMAFMSNPGGSGVPERFASTSEDDILFWRSVDRYMDYANQSGIIPVLGLTFHSGMDVASLEEWKTVWRYVIARYGAHAVTWLICGEYNQNNVPDRVSKVLALGQFIKETDPYQRAMTVHPWAYSVEQRQAWSEPWYDFTMFQGAHGGLPPVSLYYQSYWQTPTRPVLEAECRYEGIYGFTASDVRLAAYRSIQSGSFGYTYGSHGLWYPTQHEDDDTFSEWGEPMPWWEALQREGGAQMQHLRRCYESVEWWKLVPRPNAVSTNTNPDEEHRILTKADSYLAFLIYFPPGPDPALQAVLHHSETNAFYAAQWFNPRTGQTTSIPDLQMQSGELQLPPQPDSDDWLLILKKNP